MSKILQSLTKEQEATLVTQREHWLEVGLNTDPANFDECVKAAIDIYKCAGLTPPDNYYLFSSPASASIGALLIDPDNKFEKYFETEIITFRTLGLEKYLEVERNLKDRPKNIPTNVTMNVNTLSDFCSSARSISSFFLCFLLLYQARG